MTKTLNSRKYNLQHYLLEAEDHSIPGFAAELKEMTYVAVEIERIIEAETHKMKSIFYII